MVHNEVDKFRSLMIKSFKIKGGQSMYKNLKKTIATVLLALPLIIAGSFGEGIQAAEKNPCAVKNPCAEKPKPIRKAGIKDSAKLMEKGEKLWNYKKLGTSGASCATCHPNGKDLKKAPFPKYIKMADDILTLDQTINFCLLNPMKGKPLPGSSVEMTALAAYAQANAKEEGGAANPCAVKNPCAIKNPCGKKK